MHHHSGEGDHDGDHHDLDAHERHRPPIDLRGFHRLGELARDLIVIRQFGRDRAQEEQREPEGRVHERGLHVHAQDHPEPDQIDPEAFGRGGQERDDDEGQFEEIEEEGEEEHQERHNDQKADLATGKRGEQMLDPQMPVYPVEGQREHPRAQKDEHHEGRKPRGRRQRLTDHIHRKAFFHEGQNQRPDSPHRAALGGRCHAEEDRPQHEEDQRQRRDQHDDHLLCESRHQVDFQRLIQKCEAIDQRNRKRRGQNPRIIRIVVGLEVAFAEEEHRPPQCQRDEKRCHARPQRARLFGQGRHGLRADDRHHHDIAEVDHRQHKARNHRALIHIPHRAAQLVRQNDENQRRRDDLRQSARGRDHARGDPAVIAIAQHDRQRDQPHRDHGSGHNTRGRRQQRAHDNHRIGQTTAHGAEELANRVEQIFRHAGAFQHDPHEGEERNREQCLIREHPPEPLGHRIQQRPGKVDCPFGKRREFNTDDEEQKPVRRQREGHRIADNQEENQR